MFNKILVALETEEPCDLLFGKALRLAQTTASELVLLGVLAPGGDGTLPLLSYPEMTGYPLTHVESAWQLYQERYESYKAKGLAVLSRYLNQAITAGVQADLKQEVGEPGPVICRVAKAEEAELIIVGSHGRTGFNEFLMGSVSSYVMHRAPCSVMVDRQSVGKQPQQIAASAISSTAKSTGS